MNFFIVAFGSNMFYGVAIGIEYTIDIGYESLAKECRKQHAVVAEHDLSLKKCLAQADGNTCEQERIQAENAWMEYSNATKEVLTHLRALKDFEVFVNNDPLKEEYENKEADIYWRRFKEFWPDFKRSYYYAREQCKEDAECSSTMQNIDAFVLAPHIDDRFDTEFTALRNRLKTLRNNPSLPYFVDEDMGSGYKKLSEFAR
jgi:hypothetical protein